MDTIAHKLRTSAHEGSVAFGGRGGHVQAVVRPGFVAHPAHISHHRAQASPFVCDEDD
jgi:hypothetical protein